MMKLVLLLVFLLLLEEPVSFIKGAILVFEGVLVG
jgi:hypothetical protein